MSWFKRSLAIAGTVVLMSGAARELPAQGSPPPDFLVTVRSAQDFNTTLTSLKQAIEAQNLMVVNEVNPQQMLRMVGMQTGGMRQIFFFHPRFMKAIIETNRNGGIEPPLKILVMEAPDGRVMVRYHDPVHQFAPYDGLAEIAAEFSGVFEDIVSSVRQ
jgi:uncharacterized protein (DUF302 family)